MRPGGRQVNQSTLCTVFQVIKGVKSQDILVQAAILVGADHPAGANFGAFELVIRHQVARVDLKNQRLSFAAGDQANRGNRDFGLAGRRIVSG